jgi:glycosyltransferase involved in cell wall biosynthesis
MTHVCVITSVHKPFDGRIFYRECCTLAQAGYNVTLVAPADFERKEREGVTVLGVTPAASRLQRICVWRDILRRVRALKPDVIHFHDPELLLLVPLFRLRFGKQVKIIYDVHEYFIAALVSKYWIPKRLRPIVARIAAVLEKLIIRQVDGMICAVEGQLALYKFHGPKAVVRNLPLASLFKDAEPHPALDAPGFKLVYVGLILPKRAIDILLEAMRILHERGHDDIHLYLIGPETSTEYMQTLQAFIRQHGLDAQVKWIGYIPPHELEHYLANADVGLVPGLYTPQYKNPGLTTKLFEYLLMGLPVLSVDYPHRRIYIEESKCGLVVEAEDVQAHVEAILWFYRHPQEGQSMGARGQAMVKDHYIWEKEAVHLIEFYKQIVS